MRIKDRVRAMLQLIRSCGSGWHDRMALASALGKARLNPADLIMLDLLEDRGKIEKRYAPGTQEHVNLWVYRLKA